jgi:peptidoglycan/xylan/chitin deacetylase (PgdA/CDA1 family)
MLAWLKETIEFGLATLLVLALRLTRRRAGVAIVYHAVGLHQGDPGRELVPARERSRFHQELRYLRRNFRPVSARNFAAAVAERRRFERFPVCVTFDDDLSSHFEHALGPLQEEDMPATFFLCGASLEAPRSFWWERLQRAFDRGVPLCRILDLVPRAASKRFDGEEPDIHRVAALIRDLTPVERNEIDARLLELAGPDPPDSGLPAEVISNLPDGEYDIGFHTLRHHQLVQLNDHDLGRALLDGRDELQAAVRRPVELIAYPHGAANERVARAAQRAGFRAGFTTRRRAMTASWDPMLIGRLQPDHKRSLGEFSLAVNVTLLVSPKFNGRGCR